MPRDLWVLQNKLHATLEGFSCLGTIIVTRVTTQPTYVQLRREMLNFGCGAEDLGELLAKDMPFSRRFHLNQSYQLLERKKKKPVSSKPDGERL